MKIAVVFGSTRDNRRGIKVARYIVDQTKKRGHSVTLVDPLEYDIPVLRKMYKSYDNPPKMLEELATIFREADAIIPVSAEYNHSIPPALSNILDHFLEEFFWKPSAIVTYSKGGFGGVRAAMQLRAMLGELGMPSIPSIFAVSRVDDAIDDEGQAIEQSYDRRIQRFLDELEWYAIALKNQREQGTPY